MVLNTLDALFLRNMHTGRFHTAAGTGQDIRISILRIVIHTSCPHLILRVLLIREILEAFFLCCGNQTAVSVNIKNDFAPCRAVIPVRIRPGQYIAAQLFVFIIIPVVRCLNIVRRFNESGGHRSALQNNAFQVHGTKCYTIGQFCADTDLIRRTGKKNVLVQLHSRPDISIKGISILPVRHRLRGSIHAKCFHPDGIGIPIQRKHTGFIHSGRVGRIPQQDGSFCAAPMQVALGIQTQLRHLMRRAILVREKAGVEALILQNTVHVLPLNGQLSLRVVFDFRHCFGKIAACCVKCSDRPEQLRLPANGGYFIHARDIQPLQDRARTA